MKSYSQLQAGDEDDDDEDDDNDIVDHKKGRREAKNMKVKIKKDIKVKEKSLQKRKLSSTEDNDDHDDENNIAKCRKTNNGKVSYRISTPLASLLNIDPRETRFKVSTTVAFCSLITYKWMIMMMTLIMMVI